MQWNINGCRDEPVQPVEPVFVERIEAVKQACELLEMQYNTQPACISCDFCVCVTVPPYNCRYLVKLCMDPQRLRRNNSASRPAGGRAKASRVGQLMENDKRKRKKKEVAE